MDNNRKTKQPKDENNSAFSIGAVAPKVMVAPKYDLGDDDVQGEGQKQRSGLPGRQPIRYNQEQSPYATRQRRSERHDAPPSAPPNEEAPRKSKGQQNNGPRPQKSSKKHGFLYMVVILLCVAALGAIGVLMAPQMLGLFSKWAPNYAFANGKILAWDEQSYQNHQIYKSYLNRNTFFPGLYIDGQSLGDQTIEQARGLLETNLKEEGQSFCVTMTFEEQSYTIDNQHVQLYRNSEELLERAYAIGRQNSTNILGTGITPFAQRIQTVDNLRQSALSFSSQMTYDKQAVKTQVEAFVESLALEPVDSQLKSFDFVTRTFSFTQETDGFKVDGEKLYEQVIEKLDRGEQGSIIEVQGEKVLPAVTKVELMNNFKKISSSTTKTTSNSNRNNNINLSAKALNGRVLYPGDSLSFNDTTGKRTEAAGYKEAVAISGGQNVPDIGGGVCQTSTTLFNAVLMADLKVEKRTPHAWPSSYVDIGMDATVNWPNLDFVFTNNQDYPIFIIAYYEDQEVTVEIYGKSLGPGITIALESETTNVIEPPSDVQYVRNEKLPAGTQKATTKARKGYEAITYKIWYKDGVEFQRESFPSKYRMYANTIEYN